MSDASVPPAATTPAANFLSYPILAFRIAIRANTADVATEAPETARRTRLWQKPLQRLNHLASIQPSVWQPQRAPS